MAFVRLSAAVPSPSLSVQVMMALSNHLNAVESEKQKLRAQVRRLCRKWESEAHQTLEEKSLFLLQWPPGAIY